MLPYPTDLAAVGLVGALKPRPSLDAPAALEAVNPGVSRTLRARAIGSTPNIAA